MGHVFVFNCFIARIYLYISRYININHLHVFITIIICINKIERLSRQLCAARATDNRSVYITRDLTTLIRCYSYVGQVNLFPQPINLQVACLKDVSIVVAWSLQHSLPYY